MNLVLSVFPRRPIRILWTGVLSPLRSGGGALLFLLLAGAAATWMGPGILRDMKIQQAPVAVSGGQITDGRCRTNLVLTICGAKLAYNVSGRPQTASVDFFFVDFHLGNYAVSMVRSSARPELATLDIGLNKIWNRVGTLLVIVALLLGVSCTAVRRTVDATRLERIAATVNRLWPVAVTVKKIAKDRHGSIAVLCSYEDHGREREFVQSFPKPGIPFLLNGRSALAVRPADSPAVVLVDEALTKLDLTHAERQALYAARSGVAVQPGWSYAAAAS